MPVAVITFDFDPLLRLGDGLAVRWQTVALAIVIAIVLMIAALICRRAALRADDLLFIAVGIVPGAVLAGRIGYGVQHLDVFGADPAALLDPARGGLELASGVLGGALTGTIVTSLLRAPVGRWAHVAALPVLLALGAGKLTMVLGGSGQGLHTNGPEATSYTGAGPWGSLAPDLPSIPAQTYEGVGTLAFTVLVVSFLALGACRGRDGRLLLFAIAGWAFIRAAVSLTWRDPVELGPFSVGGVLAIAVGLTALVGFAAVSVVEIRRARAVRDIGPARDAGP